MTSGGHRRTGCERWLMLGTRPAGGQGRCLTAACFSPIVTIQEKAGIFSVIPPNVCSLQGLLLPAARSGRQGGGQPAPPRAARSPGSGSPARGTAGGGQRGGRGHHPPPSPAPP